MLSSSKNTLHELPNELPNEVRLRILGFYKMLKKSKKSVEAESIAQFPLQK